MKLELDLKLEGLTELNWARMKKIFKKIRREVGKIKKIEVLGSPSIYQDVLSRVNGDHEVVRVINVQPIYQDGNPSNDFLYAARDILREKSSSKDYVDIHTLGFRKFTSKELA